MQCLDVMVLETVNAYQKHAAWMMDAIHVIVYWFDIESSSGMLSSRCHASQRRGLNSICPCTIYGGGRISNVLLTCLPAK